MSDLTPNERAFLMQLLQSQQVNPAHPNAVSHCMLTHSLLKKLQEPAPKPENGNGLDQSAVEQV